MGWKFLVILLFVIIVLLATPSNAADAIMAYRSNTGSCAANALNCPKVRIWSSDGSGSWGSEAELPTAGSPIREALVRHSSASQKIVLVTQSDDGFLDAYVCTSNCAAGSSWTVSNNIGQVWSAAPATHSRRFDVGFETATGDALVVYGVLSTSTTCDLGYKVLPAGSSSFSGIAEQCIDDDSANGGADLVYTWVSLDGNSSSTSEQLIVVGFDSSGSDVNAWVWSESGWGNRIELTAAATATSGREALAVKYAADATKGMVIAGDGLVGNVVGQYWSGSAWTAADPGDVDGTDNVDVNWIKLKADPATDDLMAVFVDSGSDLHAAYWSGASWTVTSNHDLAVDVIAGRPADFEWNPSGSTGKLVWDTDTTGTTLNVSTWTTGSGWVADPTISSYAAAGRWVALYGNPTDSNTVNVLGGRLNANFDIGSFSWDGGSFANYGDSVITADTTVATFEAFTISFDTVPPVWSSAQDNSSYKIRRGDAVNISAVWNDTLPLNQSWLSTNETGAFVNYTGYPYPPRALGNSPSLTNWTWQNQTGKPRVIGWVIYANDSGNNINGTNSPGGVVRNFTMYGWSNVTWNSPSSGSSFTVGSAITLTAFINDTNTSGSGPIQDYPVRFYWENSTQSTSLGTNYTNSSGYAIWRWSTAGFATGNYFPKANITNNDTLYYDVAPEFQNANTTVTLNSPSISISLSNSPVSFGSMSIGQSDDTTDNSPLPFVIQNDGNADVNVTIEATDLWSTSANPTSNYQFRCGNTGEASCASGSVTSFTNIPASGNPTLAIAYLAYTDASDTNEAEIRIVAPSSEPPGPKSSTVTFIASQA